MEIVRDALNCPRGGEVRSRDCRKIRACVSVGSNDLVTIRPGGSSLVDRVLSPSGLGHTCLRIMQGGKIKNISEVSFGRLLPCLRRRGSRLVRSVHVKECGPGSIHEMSVTGSGKGGQLVNVPAIISHLVRRTVIRILSPVCRHRFDPDDFKFHPSMIHV